MTGLKGRVGDIGGDVEDDDDRDLKDGGRPAMNGRGPIVIPGTDEPSPPVEDDSSTGGAVDAETSVDSSSSSSAVGRDTSAATSSQGDGTEDGVSSTNEQDSEGRGDDEGSTSFSCDGSIDDVDDSEMKRPQQQQQPGDPSSPSSATTGAYPATVTTCSESASSGSSSVAGSSSAGEVQPPPIRRGLVRRRRGRRKGQDASSQSSGTKGSTSLGWLGTLASTYTRLRDDVALATSTPPGPDASHRQLTSRLYAQMELLALSTVITLGLLLYLILGLVGNVLLASAFASFVMLVRTVYTCTLLELGDTRRTVRDNGVISYLPDSISAYLTTTTLNEWMTDSTMFLEWRFLLVYFIPGLTSEQLSELVQRLPKRRRELLFGTGFIRRIFMPESWDAYLFPAGDPRGQERSSSSAAATGVPAIGNGDDADDDDEEDFDDGRLILHNDEGNGAGTTESGGAGGAQHSQLAGGGPPTDLVWPHDDDESGGDSDDDDAVAAAAAGSSCTAVVPTSPSSAEPATPAPAPAPAPAVGPTPEEEEQDGRVLSEATQTVVNYVTGSITVLISTTVEYAIDASLPYVTGGGVALSFASGIAGFVTRRGRGGGGLLGLRFSVGGGGGSDGGGGGAGSALPYTLALFSFAMLGSAGGMYALRSYLRGVETRATYTRDHSLPPPTPQDEAAEGVDDGGGGGRSDGCDDGNGDNGAGDPGDGDGDPTS